MEGVTRRTCISMGAVPVLTGMAAYAARGLVIVGLSVDRGSADVVRGWLRERGVGYPVAVVGAAEERAFGGVRGYPTSFLIGRDGVVRHAVIGPLAPATLELAVRRLLAEPPPGDSLTSERPPRSASAR